MKLSVNYLGHIVVHFIVVTYGTNLKAISTWKQLYMLMGQIYSAIHYHSHPIAPGSLAVFTFAIFFLATVGK